MTKDHYADREPPPSYSKVVRALMGDDEAPDKEVPCMNCGKMFTLEGFIYAAVVYWNHEENESAAFANVRPNFIRTNEIAACPECVPAVRARKDAEQLRIRELTALYMRELKAGRYNPETLGWLREHGHSELVEQVLNSEGT